MSDNNDDFSVNEQGQTAGRGRAEQPQREEPRAQTRQSEPRVTSGFTLADLGRAQARPTVGGVSDAALSAMLEVFETAKTFDKPNVPTEIKRSNFRAFPMDQSTGKSSIASLLIVLPTTVAAQDFTLVYVLLIEQPGGPGLRNLTDRGESFEALILPEDAMTDNYRKVIREQVAGLQPGGKVILVGNQVLTHYTIARATEKEGQTLLGRIYDNALDAICGVRENLIDNASGNRNDGMRINPTMVARNDRLEVAFDYSGKTTDDSSGLQVRSDVTGVLYYSASNPDEDNMYSRTPLGEIRGGLDLFYSEDAEETQRRGIGRGIRRREVEDAPFYQAVFNITSINSPAGVPFSLELAQLLLAQAAHQSNDYRWVNMARPRQVIAGGMKSVWQPSHLHLLHPNPEAAGIVTDISQNTNESDLNDYLDVTVKPDIIFGMVIPSSGEKSWSLSIYERIATTGGEEQSALIETLFSSADVLTGGRFTPIFNRLTKNNRESPVSTSGSRAFIGTWTDQDGFVRDVREWNVQAVLTAMGAKNVETVRDFQYTFEDLRRSIEFNLAQRFNILNRFVPGLHIVGTCEQLMFNPAYIQALSEALAAADMASVTTNSDGLGMGRRVGNTNFSLFATSNIGQARRRPGDVDSRGARRSRWDTGNNY